MKKDYETHRIRHSLCVICPVPKRINWDSANIFLSMNYFPLKCGGGGEDAQNLFLVWNLLSRKISFEGNYFNINFEVKVLTLPDRCIYISLTCLQSILQAEISHLLETKEVTQALENKIFFLIWTESIQVAY